MGNSDIYERVRRVPPEAQKEIKGGRMKGMTDINPMWRIKILTEIYGPCGIGWYYIPTKKWIETFENTIAAFVDIELFVKNGDGWSMPISGTGGSMFVAKENSGPFVSDECYKMATTDAISVACKQLGIGADVYWGTDKSKYSGNDTTGNLVGKPVSELPTTPTTKPSNKPIADYRCEMCNKAFVDFEWRDKHYTAQDGYEMAKKKCGGKALCNKCKKEAGIL